MKNLKGKKITILLVLVEIVVLIAVLIYSVVFGRISVFKLFSKADSQTVSASEQTADPETADDSVNAILNEEYEAGGETETGDNASAALPTLSELVKGRNFVSDYQAGSQVENIVSAMTEDQKIYQVIMTTIDGFDKAIGETQVNEQTRSNYEEAPLGGIVFTKENFVDSDQFGIMRNAVQEYSMDISPVTCFVVNNEVDPVPKGNGLRRFLGWNDASTAEDLSEKKLVMITKKPVPKITGYAKLPGTVSVNVVDYIRNDLNFNGVLVSGDLCNELVSEYYSVADAAVAAFYAGCDMLYCTNGYEEVYTAIKGALADGTISETMLNNAVRRVITLKLLS